MDVKEAIETRRALRSLEAVNIETKLIDDLAHHAGLAPSCYNKQPWRFVFVHEPKVLQRLFSAISSGNAWTRQASLVVAVFSREDLDCIVKERSYYLFDTGISVGFLLLRATELGLVAHPIAGFDEAKVKDILGIPAGAKAITLVIIGKKADNISPFLNEKMAQAETNRPARLETHQYAFHNICGLDEISGKQDQ